jgi:Tfp pilus assembly protein PilO
MLNLLNKLNKIELDKKKISLIVLVCLVILYLDFTFFLKSQVQNIRDLGPKIKQLRLDIDTLNKDLAYLEALKDKQTGLLSKAKKIISEDQLPLLFKDISDMANKSNVKIMQMKPEVELQSEVKAQGKFLPILLAIDLSCGYHALGKFINTLETSAQFMAVQDIGIESDKKDYLRQNVKLVVMSCVKK